MSSSLVAHPLIFPMSASRLWLCHLLKHSKRGKVLREGTGISANGKAGRHRLQQ